MRKRRKNRILRRLVLGLAVAAFVVPTTAQAYPVEGTPGTHGSAVVIQGDDKELVPPVGPGVIQGDDKVLGPRGNHFAGPVRGDDKVIVVTPEVAPVEAVRSPSSFDWGDALIGAGAAFALMLLAGTAVLAMRHGRPATA
jgi:hypothetical protein